MSANTILLDFSVDPSAVKNESQVSVVSSNIENVLREYLANLKVLTTIRLETDLLKLYSSDGGLSATLRIFNTGLITLNIEFFKGESQEALLSFEVILLKECLVYFVKILLQRTKVLEQKLRIVLNCYRSKLLPPIKRGAYIDVYILSSGEFLGQRLFCGAIPS